MRRPRPRRPRTTAERAREPALRLRRLRRTSRAGTRAAMKAAAAPRQTARTARRRVERAVPPPPEPARPERTRTADSDEPHLLCASRQSLPSAQIGERAAPVPPDDRRSLDRREERVGAREAVAQRPPFFLGEAKQARRRIP